MWRFGWPGLTWLCVGGSEGTRLVREESLKF